MKYVLSIMLLSVAQVSNSVAPLEAVQNACSQLANSPEDSTVLRTLPGISLKITDSGLRAAVVATYAMGMLYIGEDQAAQHALQHIKERFPDSRQIALFDGARYMVDCPKCSGTGTVEKPCTRCQGTGTCQLCGGKGSTSRHRFNAPRVQVRCSSCGGSGHCTACGGIGREEGRCPQCMGRGKVMSRHKIKDAYLQLIRETSQMASADKRSPEAPVLAERPTHQESVSSRSVSPHPHHFLPEVLENTSERLLQSLKDKEVTRLAVSRVYFNGSGVHPVAQYIQRKLLGEVLNHAPEGLVIMERQDLRLLVKENQLQWMIGEGTEDLADESEALPGLMWPEA